MGSPSPAAEGYEYTTLKRTELNYFQNLHVEITLYNIIIDRLPTDKAPNPDDFTSEFYKNFRLFIVPDLLAVYNNVMQNEQLTLAPLNDSFIILLSKKKTNALHLKNFQTNQP
jgi:hypothetical protein